VLAYEVNRLIGQKQTQKRGQIAEGNSVYPVEGGKQMMMQAVKAMTLQFYRMQELPHNLHSYALTGKSCT